MKKFIVLKEENGQTLEKYVRKIMPLAPLGFIYKLFRKKDIKVNGHWQDKKYVINTNDEIAVYVTDAQLEEFEKVKSIRNLSNISSWIVYEDNNILIINKPRGVLVQKDDSNCEALDDMVISYLTNKKEYDPNINRAFTPAPVHRLDRNTSGLVIFGKNLIALQEMADAIKDKTKITKKYYALVDGITDMEGKIDYSLKKLNNGRVIKDEQDGKESHTVYKRIKCYGEYSLLEVTLLTGRTHQIRVHLSLIEHPVIGDSKYGNYELNKQIEEKYNFKNQFLVSYYLGINNLTGELKYLNNKEFKIEIPYEMMELLFNLNNNK